MEIKEGAIWIEESTHIARIFYNNHWHYITNCPEECCQLKYKNCSNKCKSRFVDDKRNYIAKMQ